MAASARRPDGRPSGSRSTRDPQRSARAGEVGRQRARRPAPGVGALVGEFVLRNPLALGSGTAFLVALSFVSANAIWGQTERHASAFFATRALPAAWNTEAAITGAIARPAADPTLRRVQAELGRMGLYDGALDGLPGPNTRKGVAAFQARNGLSATGEIDGALLALLERQAEAPANDAARAKGSDDAVASLPAAGDDDDRQRMMKVQAGLKAFGVDGIEVDGIIGARTRAGIREFQAMFKLPETGEPDEALLAKMRETGLTD